MPIDHSLYLQQRGMQSNPMDSLEQGLRLRDMMDQRKIQAQERQESMKRQEMMDRRQSQKDSQERQMQQIEMITRLAPAVKDQPSYEAALGTMKQAGFDVSQLPPQYDKGLVDTYAAMALSAKDRMMQANADREYKLQEKKLGLESSRSAEDRRRWEAEHQLGRDKLAAQKDKNLRPVYDASGNVIGYEDGAQAKGPQYQAALFGRRIEQAEDAFKSLEERKYNRADRLGATLDALTPNVLLPENRKLQDQAERNFVNAILRRESGAAISKSEFSNAEQQYFPRAGDSEEVLKQKAANREVALAALRAESGPAWGQVPKISVDRKTQVAGPAPRTEIQPSNKAHALPIIDGSKIEWAD